MWSSSAEFNSLTLVGGLLLCSTNSKYGETVIELRGSSEDGEDLDDDSIPIVDQSTTTEYTKIKPRGSIRETKYFAPKGELMSDRPSLSAQQKEWMQEPDEEEEVLEKGNPPRRPARRE